MFPLRTPMVHAGANTNFPSLVVSQFRCDQCPFMSQRLTDLELHRRSVHFGHRLAADELCDLRKCGSNMPHLKVAQHIYSGPEPYGTNSTNPIFRLHV